MFKKGSRREGHFIWLSLSEVCFDCYSLIYLLPKHYGSMLFWCHSVKYFCPHGRFKISATVLYGRTLDPHLTAKEAEARQEVNLPNDGTRFKPRHGSRIRVFLLSELWSVIPDIARAAFCCCFLDKAFCSLWGSDQ